MRETLALLIPSCAMAAAVPSLVSCVGGHSRAAAAALALCLGIGFSSVTTIALLVSGIAIHSSAFVVIDAAIWTLVGGAGLWINRGVRVNDTHLLSAGDNANRVGWIVRAVVVLAGIMALMTTAVMHTAAPHGEWDAWAIWNLRARFLFRDVNAWTNAFDIVWSQPDYPLLLPASVARVWAYAGYETTIGPFVIAVALASATVVLVMAALDLRHQRSWMAGAILLGGSAFIAQVPAQCADVPLAAFMLATLAVVCGHGTLLTERPHPHAAAWVAGAMSALTAWTKNEGLVLELMMMVVVTIVMVRRGAMRQLAWWAAGGAPVIIAIAWLKLTSGTNSSLVEGQTIGLFLDRLADVDRHVLAATLMGQHLRDWGGTLTTALIPALGIPAVLVALVRGTSAMRLAVSVVALMLSAYYAVYVTTRFDIRWHVETSFVRLLAQVWPLLVFAAFLPFARGREGELDRSR